MKTFTKTYDEFNGFEYIEKKGEFTKTSNLEKLKKVKRIIKRAAVDYCHPNYFLHKGTVWEENTFWENTMLRGCGQALNTGKTPEEYLGENCWASYYLN